MKGLTLIESFTPISLFPEFTDSHIERELALVDPTEDYRRVPVAAEVEVSFAPPMVKGTVEYPLTERIASDIATHGEAWARSYHAHRGFAAWELEVLIAGAKAYVVAQVQRPSWEDCVFMPFDGPSTEPMVYA